MLYTGIGQMMLDDIKEDVSRWIVEWVNSYHDDLGTKPCPFALNALSTGSIDWLIAENGKHLRSILVSLSSDGLTNEVLVIGMHRSSITPPELNGIIESCNSEMLMPAGIVALQDHPDDPELINGVVMNQGTWVLILVQRLESLNSAADSLRSRGYYDRWSDANLDDVVRWRYPKNPDP